jgi:hypothetical protein
MDEKKILSLIERLKLENGGVETDPSEPKPTADDILDMIRERQGVNINQKDSDA